MISGIGQDNDHRTIVEEDRYFAKGDLQDIWHTPPGGETVHPPCGWDDHGKVTTGGPPQKKILESYHF